MDVDVVRKSRIIVREMRTNLLDSLLPKTRRDILVATVMHPERSWYLSDLARHLGTRASSLQRELTSLTHAGILIKAESGNRTYFRANPDCPILPELRGLLVKTAGLIDKLREALAPARDRIDLAFVYGSIARGTEDATSDIDLTVVGDVGLSELASMLRPVEEALGRSVNPTVYTGRELAQKRRKGHHFVSRLLKEEKLFVYGDDGDLAALGERKEA
jgi:predicted nucleotidyltransferase